MKEESEVLRETQEINCQLIEDVPDDQSSPVTLRHTSCPKIGCSIDNSTGESGDDSGNLPVRSPENQKVVLPHHLRSKVAGTNSLKKAARILAVGFFTVKECCSCTVPGSSNKSNEDTKRPQFNTYRMSLIHEFLQKTYPNSYQHEDVNSIIGQVAIESRQGPMQLMTLLFFHSSNDSEKELEKDLSVFCICKKTCGNLLKRKSILQLFLLF
ncbi:uncharacterized protein LOC144648382 [Oculina patagonica]